VVGAPSSGDVGADEDLDDKGIEGMSDSKIWERRDSGRAASSSSTVSLPSWGSLAAASEGLAVTALPVGVQVISMAGPESS
jgi:hypothetical protein